MNIKSFVAEVQKIYTTGVATEHSYRSALQHLFSSIEQEVTALNEPKRVECGAPDFLINRGKLVIGHVEAKDVDKDLSTLRGAEAEQKQRYLDAFPNLIYTNCLTFEFYRDGDLINRISIADFGLRISPKPDQFAVLQHHLKDFAAQRPQTITSPERLVEIMAGKAVLIKTVLFNALREDKNLQTELVGQYEAFREHLIHNITREDFADIYAETVAYGMFAARLHDDTLGDFGRREAMELIPKSNPFLRALFTYIAGPSLDERIKWIIDDLGDVFQATNITQILTNLGSMTGRADPFLHFYETFLAKYNPKKRKARGVWYTPEPVVNFIVRAVDHVLTTTFSLPLGLADTSKVTVDLDNGQNGQRGTGQLAETQKTPVENKQLHRVQILDPATGTGTFLAEVIKQIAPKIKNVAKGIWSQYIETNLIPRLHGFELLMASYAMCHMKLDMVLAQLGYVPSGAPPRLSVYLTNSLEEAESDNQTLPFARWLSNEVKQANAVKRDMPIMCVIGNPPYNASSKNTNDWILQQVSRYKVGLGEKKVNLDDDYIKFLRLSEHFIEKTGRGIVAMITNNSFLDGVSHRLMRKHLLQTFDNIYVLNLHGDIRNESTAGKKDANVFDIRQGVAISIMVRKDGESGKDASIVYGDLVGSRVEKYQTLEELTIASNRFRPIPVLSPNYRFKRETNGARDTYEQGVPLNELFLTYSSGVQTKKDKVCVAMDRAALARVVKDFQELDAETLRTKYEIPKDGRDWTISAAKADVRNNEGQIIQFLYKPFDVRFLYYTGQAKGFVAYPRRDVMQHMVHHDNIALISNRQNVRNYFSFVGVTRTVCNHGTFYLGNRGQDYCFPLYLYPTSEELEQHRRANFREELFAKVVEIATGGDGKEPTELDVFDYVYGVLHSGRYREQFADSLRLDFPRIPWPESPLVFWRVVDGGRRLRRLHLMEEAEPGKSDYPFVGEGDAVIGVPRFRRGKVWINNRQGFENIPKSAWEFPVGGYQPAQTWLKARKGRQLSFDDIVHYQKVIKVLLDTGGIVASL